MRSSTDPSPYAVGCLVGVVLVLFIPALILCNVLGFFGGVVNDATNVLHEEVGPRALLRKYEWFKDASAALDAKKASIEVYRKRLVNLRRSYGDAPRKDWARTDLEDINQWESEQAGIVASYNSLAAEYNAAMAKVNWKFTNAGDLPAGADVPLPREYRAYLEE